MCSAHKFANTPPPHLCTPPPHLCTPPPHLCTPPPHLCTPPPHLCTPLPLRPTLQVSLFYTHTSKPYTYPPPPLPPTHTHIPTLHTSQLPTLPQRLVVLHIVFLFSLFLCYLLLQHNSRLLPQTTLKKGFRWYIIHLNYCGCVTVCS